MRDLVLLDLSLDLYFLILMSFFGNYDLVVYIIDLDLVQI